MVSVSSTHIIVLTNEQQVYAWGEGSSGQLGNDCAERWRKKPYCIDALKGKSITRIAAGNSFSIFASDNGIVMTCGKGSSGCLGHGDWESSTRPKLVEKLLSVDVSGVSCGPEHVVVVCGDGNVYSWGCGADGRLGHGDERNRSSPLQINIPTGKKIKRVRCGIDGTMLLTTTGTVLACGSNRFNKLGLNERKGFLLQMKNLMAKAEVNNRCLPTRISGINNRVLDASLGHRHSALLVEGGNIMMFGDNSCGQFGLGNTSDYSAVQLLKSMNGKTVCMVQCGDSYTVAGTMENAIYFWGTRHYMSSDFKPFSSGFKNPNADESVVKIGPMDIANNNIPMKGSTVITQPQEILALYASPAQVAKGEIVNLTRIQCFEQNMFLVVDTTAPLPPTAYPKKTTIDKITHLVDKSSDPTPSIQSTSNSNVGMGGTNSIPSWLQQEIDESDKAKLSKRDIECRSPAKKHKKFDGGHYEELLLPGSANSSRSEHSSAQSSMGSSGTELKHELDKISKEKELVERRMLELERKLNEQEATTQSNSENKQKEEELNAEILRLQEQLSIRSSIRSSFVGVNMSPNRRPATNSKMCNIQ